MTRELIAAYIKAYNTKDLPGMLSVLSDDVRFENVSNSNQTMTLMGKSAFEAQAKRMMPVFSRREQRIESLTIEGDRAAVEINYTATVAKDLPNGWKEGQQIVLRGVSIFEGKDGTIYRISDYS